MRNYSLPERGRRIGEILHSVERTDLILFRGKQRQKRSYYCAARQGTARKGDVTISKRDKNQTFHHLRRRDIKKFQPRLLQRQSKRMKPPKQWRNGTSLIFLVANINKPDSFGHPTS